MFFIKVDTSAIIFTMNSTILKHVCLVFIEAWKQLSSKFKDQSLTPLSMKTFVFKMFNKINNLYFLVIL